MEPDKRVWRDLYEFDVPVIHISRAEEPDEQPSLSGKALKLMHRFKAMEVESMMDQAEAS